MQPTSKSILIRSKKQLAAIVSPVRQELVDALAQMGTVSVSELAATLGRPADAIYYHLRVLKKAGLVLSAGERGEGVRKEELVSAVSEGLRLEYELGAKGNGREVMGIVGSMLRLGARDFRRAFEDGEVKVSGEERELWALRRIGWLSAAELGQVNRLIESLAQAVSKPRAAGRLYGVTLVLTPLDHRARNGSKKAKAKRARTK